MDETTNLDNRSKNKEPRQSHLECTALQGYFIQSEPETEEDTYDPKAHNFGLIPLTYDSDNALDANKKHTDWERFANHISSLNTKAPQGTSYRILYLGRHGQGYHNVAHTYYGDDAWDCHYSSLDGDPEPGSNVRWKDAHLTPLGKDQAKDMCDFWRRQITEAKTPIPQSYYVSPMDRACRTALLTWQPLQDEGLLRASAPFKPTVKELLRECNGIHTCDSRSERSYITSTYPSYNIEAGFTEQDELFDASLRETDPALDRRMRDLLDDVLTHDGNTFISFTAHGGCINGILRSVGHRAFHVPVGSAIPVLLKVEEVQGDREKEDVIEWQPAEPCKMDYRKPALQKYGSLAQYVEEVEKAYMDGDKDRAEMMGKRIMPS